MGGTRYERRRALGDEAVAVQQGDLSVDGTDELTGLANRRTWDQRIENTAGLLAAGGVASVISIQIAGWELADEAHRANVRDAQVRAVATILDRWVRSTDLVARLDDAALGILLPGTGGLATRLVASRIRAHVDDHPPVGGQTIRAGIGLASSPPEPDLVEAMTEADARMCIDRDAQERARSTTAI